MTEPKKVKAKVKKLGYQQHSIPIHDDLTTEELIKSRDGWKLLCEESEERERALGEENERLKIALHTRNSYEKTVTEMQEDIEQLNVENAAMREALEKAERFMTKIMAFYGEGLEVYNWHQNGDGEPWESFFDENMDGDELELARKALGYSVWGEVTP